MSYSGDPSASAVDEVRFLIGDTIDPEKLTDDEIGYLLLTWTEPMRAAHAAAMGLAAQYAGRSSKSIGATRLEYGAISQQYIAIAKEIAKRGGFTTLAGAAIPVAGGVIGTTHEDGSAIEGEMGIDWHNYQSP